MVLITHKQNISCSKTHLDDTTHEQLFVGHVVGSRRMERKKRIASNDGWIWFYFCLDEKLAGNLSADRVM